MDKVQNTVSLTVIFVQFTIRHSSKKTFKIRPTFIWPTLLIFITLATEEMYSTNI
jgi:hypothetical protein